MADMTTKLNDKQMKFARGLAQGKNNTEAYRAAYGMNMSMEAASAAATRLLKNVKVAEKVKELREAVDAQAVVGRQEILERLSKQFRKADEEGDRSGMVKVVGELNKMMGGYEPEKVKVEGELSVRKLLDNIAGAE